MSEHLRCPNIKGKYGNIQRRSRCVIVFCFLFFLVGGGGGGEYFSPEQVVS